MIKLIHAVFLLLIILIPLELFSQVSETSPQKAFLGVELAAYHPMSPFGPASPINSETQPFVIPLTPPKSGQALSVGNLQVPAYVHKVRPNSPAEKAGIMVGDALIAVNGQLVLGYQDFIETLSRYSPGDQLTILLLRILDGENIPPEQALWITILEVFPILFAQETHSEDTEHRGATPSSQILDDLILE